MTLSSEATKVDVKETEMSEEMVEESIAIAKEGLKRCNSDKDVASFVKDEFEKKYGSTWHCVVGSSFGSRVSYEVGNFVLLQIGRIFVMIFKCGY
ncbi:unnamed protein product [Enterobius vermicularis]|uniref:Dynein light chain n=1 Tax=Enterobius vermicularis TaxID=51028 RepID=A0A0N4VFG8_ENTVE|nr:unnamed protein product [Enterobius vermicularis]